MHNAAYAALGIEAVYLTFDVPPQTLSAAVAGVRALGLRQLSISLPHKVSIMQHLDEVDETARRIGATDTAVLHAQRLVGSNTHALPAGCESPRCAHGVGQVDARPPGGRSARGVARPFRTRADRGGGRGDGACLRSRRESGDAALVR